MLLRKILGVSVKLRRISANALVRGLFAMLAAELEEVGHDRGEFEILRRIDRGDTLVDEDGTIGFWDDSRRRRRAGKAFGANQSNNLRNEFSMASREN